MGKDDYLLSQTADAFERDRLAALERQSDPFSRRYLAALEIKQGWRCLEVGAGHGFVARWLAGQVGSQGQVVPTDINLRFLTEIKIPNLEVRRHDIRADPLEPGTNPSGDSSAPPVTSTPPHSCSLSVHYLRARSA
jgi:hypothetical protein